MFSLAAVRFHTPHRNAAISNLICIVTLNEFTIFVKLASGAETELSKIVNDKGYWMFCGHSNRHQNGFALRCLIA